MIRDAFEAYQSPQAQPLPPLVQGGEGHGAKELRNAVDCWLFCIGIVLAIAAVGGVFGGLIVRALR